jgi:MFS family permease
MSKFSRTLLYVDMLATSSFGLLLPFLAVVITRRVEGATFLHVGYAVGVYALVKSIAQLAVGRAADDASSVRGRLKLLSIGAGLLTAVPLLYLVAGSLPMLLVAQVLWGVGEALVAPAWFSLFNQSLSQGHEARSWQWRETVGLLLAGAAAVAGGWLAEGNGDRMIFIAMAILAGIGNFLAIRLYRAEGSHVYRVPLASQ